MKLCTHARTQARRPCELGIPYLKISKHKEEVNRQITKILDDDIICPSTSQWNASLLIVSKKTDASKK